MKIDQIITKRMREHWPSWDLVYEWEDVMSEHLSCVINGESSLFYTKYVRAMPFLLKLLSTYKFSFIFELYPVLTKRVYNKVNIIPCIIDFFLSKEQLPQFYAAYSKNPVVLISSKEAYDFLKAEKCPLNIEHLPLSISDKYAFNSKVLNEKIYDVVLMGRQNSVLEALLKQYASSHKDFCYVYRELKDGIFNYYTSEGELIGNINTRSQYMELMQKSKIMLYAPPGIDGEEDRTKGFSQVTPRFLEAIATGCHVVARYKDNSDTRYYELNKFSKSIDTYAEFEAAVDFARIHDVDTTMYANYLQNHYTSKRAEKLIKIVEKL